MGCRENNWTLESAAFYTEVTEFHNPDEIEERPKSGCYACDIFIEGAAEWSTVAEGTNDSSSSLGNGNLVRAKLRNSINRLPIIRIIPTEMHKLKLQVRWRLPLEKESRDACKQMADCNYNYGLPKIPKREFQLCWKDTVCKVIIIWKMVTEFAAHPKDRLNFTMHFSQVKDHSWD